MLLSNFMETGFLQAMRNITFTAPPQVFVGLFLTSPGESGTEGAEISYSGYQRVPIMFSPPTVEGGGVNMRNTTETVFAKSSIDAGTVRHIGIFDSVTGGNMYLYGALTEDLPVLANENPVLRINEVLYFTVGDMANAYKIKLFNVVRGTSLQGFNPYYALYNGSPENGGNELSGLNYSRVPVAFSAPTNEAGGMLVIRNSTRTEFNVPTTNWGNFTHGTLFDNANTGEPVWIQRRDTAKPVNRLIMVWFDVNDISVGVN